MCVCETLNPNSLRTNVLTNPTIRLDSWLLGIVRYKAQPDTKTGAVRRRARGRGGTWPPWAQSPSSEPSLKAGPENWKCLVTWLSFLSNVPASAAWIPMRTRSPRNTGLTPPRRSPESVHPPARGGSSASPSHPPRRRRPGLERNSSLNEEGTHGGCRSD